MRHRSVVLVLFAIASLALSACSQLTAPRMEGDEPPPDSTADCASVPAGSIGFHCDTIIH